MDPVTIGTLIATGVELSIKIFGNQNDKSKNKSKNIEQKYQAIINFYEMLVSLYGHAALADGNIQVEEKTFLTTNLKEFCFSESEESPVFSKDLLKKMNLKEEDVIADLVKKFKTPLRLINISDYAIQKELEIFFYSQAMQLVTSDKTLLIKERKFLNLFANNLKLTSDEKLFTENKFLSGCKEEKKLLGLFKYFSRIK